MSTVATRGKDPQVPFLRRLVHLIEKLDRNGEVSAENAGWLLHEANLLTDRINDLTVENNRLRAIWDQSVPVINEAEPLKREMKMLRVKLQVSEKINESLRADRDDANAMAETWKGIVSRLTAESPRHCTLCCKGEETGEPVQPGSFGDYHESCMFRSLAEDERMRERAQ